MPFWRKRVRVEPDVLRSLDPYWVVDRTDGFVAATVPEGDEWPCGIWNAETGELVVPCVAACWLQGLDEVLIVTDEYSGNLERRHWPGKEVLEKTEIAHREGWVDHVVAAPTTTLAAVRWIDQTEAGFELFGLEKRGVRQLERRGYRTGESNLLQGPVLDPSARLAACTEGRSLWWQENDAEDEAPSPGGMFRAGRLTILDVESGVARHIDLEVELPSGWSRPTTSVAKACSGRRASWTSRRSWSISPQARSARSHSDLCSNARRDHPVDLVLRFRTLRTDWQIVRSISLDVKLVGSKLSITSSSI
jgi:hypothetical protein